MTPQIHTRRHIVPNKNNHSMNYARELLISKWQMINTFGDGDGVFGLGVFCRFNRT